MKTQYLGAPDKEKWVEIARGFRNNTNFSHCIGAVGGKQIRVIKPKDSRSVYYNYKTYFSIQFLAIWDVNYSFIFVDIGDFGKNNDASIFQNLEFINQYQKGLLDLLDPSLLRETPEKEDKKFPFLLVGDEAFTL